MTPTSSPTETLATPAAATSSGVPVPPPQFLGSPQERAVGLVSYEALEGLGAPGGSIVAAHRVYEMLIGMWAPAIVEAADDLGLFDALRDQPSTSAALAERLDTDVQATRVLLDALHVYGLVDAQPTGVNATFELPVGVAACTDSAGRFSLVGKFRHDRHRAWPAWQKLADTVRRGNLDEGHLQQNQISTRDYLDLADGISFWAPPLVHLLSAQLRTMGWKAAGSVLDVGCGAGQYSRLLLQTFPEATATGFDVPGIAESAEQAAKDAGVGDRFASLYGDFWSDTWPGGQDLVLLCNIYHLLPPEGAQQITELARQALSEQGLVCIVDQIRLDAAPRETPQDRFSVLFAASMLATGGGDTYSLSQYDEWLDRAGLVRAALLDGPMHRILLARRK